MIDCGRDYLAAVRHTAAIAANQAYIVSECATCCCMAPAAYCSGERIGAMGILPTSSEEGAAIEQRSREADIAWPVMHGRRAMPAPAEDSPEIVRGGIALSALTSGGEYSRPSYSHAVDVPSTLMASSIRRCIDGNKGVSPVKMGGRGREPIERKPVHGNAAAVASPTKAAYGGN